VRAGDLLELEPDEQARGVVHLIFDKFAELGSMSAVRRYLRENSIRIGVREHRGPQSLLAGRVICGRCGKRMSVSYSGHTKARFTCDMSRNQWGESQCQSLNARPLHELIERQLLIALAPASLELGLRAAQQVEADREQVAKHHQLAVQPARYQSELARGRYEAVDHKNRLVAAELERRWEAALVEQRTAEETLDRFLQQQPTRLTAEQTARVHSLASDIPALWRADSTSGIERQTILRALVQQVVVEVLGQSERVAVTIRWAGGFESQHEIRRAVGKFKQESADEIRSRIIGSSENWPLVGRGIQHVYPNILSFSNLVAVTFCLCHLLSLCWPCSRVGTQGKAGRREWQFGSLSNKVQPFITSVLSGHVFYSRF